MCDVPLLGNTYCVCAVLRACVGNLRGGHQCPGGYIEVWEEGSYQYALNGRSSDWESDLNSTPALRLNG